MLMLRRRLRQAVSPVLTSPAEPGQLLRARARARKFAAALPPSSASAGTAPGPGNLETYFDAVADGPGIWKWRHYFPIYERHFARFVGREVHVVEIGIFSGGSLAMWRDYFGAGCHVHGVDIQQACRVYANDHVDVHVGDQADPAFWADFRAKVPRVDIVIDDGGHVPEQQIATLEGLLVHMQPGGVFLCEDIVSRGNPFEAYVGALSDGLNGVGRSIETEDRRIFEQWSLSALQQTVASVHRYPFVTVIEKPAAPPPPLESVRRGTEWQPFLGVAAD